MIPRLITILAIHAAAILVLHREAGRGTFQPVEAGYFAWLSANARLPEIRPEVTFLRLDRTLPGTPGTEFGLADAESIFGEWPPSPLDYALLLENLAPFEPAVTAVEPVLHLDPGDPVTAPILTEKARSLRRLALGITLTNAPADARGLAGDPGVPEPLLAALPPENIVGNHENLPSFSRVLEMTAEPLMMNGNAEVGFTEIDFGEGPTREADGTVRIPLLARSQSGIILPSLGLRVLMIAHDVPPDQLTARLGSEIRVGTTLRLPIDARGRLPAPPQAFDALLRIPADDLFLDFDSKSSAFGQEEHERLGQTRDGIVVLGLDSESDRRFRIGGAARSSVPERISRAEAVAVTVAAARGGMFFRSPTEVIQFLIWSGLSVLSGALVASSRSRTLGAIRVVLVTVAYAVTVLLVFQSTLVWWPATIPASILATSLVLALLLPLPPKPGTIPTPDAPRLDRPASNPSR